MQIYSNYNFYYFCLASRKGLYLLLSFHSQVRQTDRHGHTDTHTHTLWDSVSIYRLYWPWSDDPPASAFSRTGITSMNHHVRLSCWILLYSSLIEMINNILSTWSVASWCLLIGESKTKVSGTLEVPLELWKSNCRRQWHTFYSRLVGYLTLKSEGKGSQIFLKTIVLCYQD